MKIFLLVLFCIPYINSSYSQKNDLQKNQLQGKVKSVFNLDYVYFNNDEIDTLKVDGLSFHNKKKHYNKDGNIYLQETFDPRDSSFTTFSYSSFNENSLIDTLSWSSIFKADKTIFFYNSNNQLDYLHVLDSFGLIWTYTNFIYNNAKTISLEEGFNFQTDSLLYRKKYIYNTEGYLKQTTTNYLEIYNQTDSTYFEYNDLNHLVKTSTFNYADGVVFDTLYNFFNQNSLIKKQVNSHHGFTNTYEFSYTYDKHGNWVSKVIFRDEKIITISKRKIVYYD